MLAELEIERWAIISMERVLAKLAAVEVTW